jgi:hypothetical protein
MKNFSIGIASAFLAVGLAGSVAAYRTAAGVGPEEPGRTAASTAAPAAQVVQPGTRFRWAPCPPPSHLEDGVCVTEVVRTVVVPPPAASQPGPAAARLDGDDEGDDRGDDSGGYDDGDDDTRSHEDTGDDDSGSDDEATDHGGEDDDGGDDD